MCRLLLTAAAYNQALIVIKGMEHIPDVTSHMTRPMDIWWARVRVRARARV